RHRIASLIRFGPCKGRISQQESFGLYRVDGLFASLPVGVAHGYEVKPLRGWNLAGANGTAPAACSTFASTQSFPYNPTSFSGLRMRYPVGFRPLFLLWAKGEF